MYEMKDSGIAWVGEIPSHWAKKRIKFIADQAVQDSFIDGDWIESPYITDEGIRYLTSGNVGDGYFKQQGNGYISQSTFEELNCKFAYPGDLVISRLNAPYGRACILTNSKDKYVLAVDVVILRTRENKHFLCYLMQCDGYQGDVNTKAKGTAMRRISRTDLGNILLPLPPRNEQDDIADYLDAQCSKIDKAISRHEAAITKLGEYRKALIHKTVTKGLNPDVEMKDSGVAWLGKIPCNWNVNKIKYASPLRTTRAENNLGYIGLENIESWTGKYITTENSPTGDSIVVHKNDVLFGKLRPYLAKAYLAENDGCSSGEFLVLRPSLVSPKYLLYYLLSPLFVNAVDVSTYGTKMPRANPSFIGNLIIPIPPNNEQQAIADFLDIQCAKIDEAISRQQAAIEKLKEYRKSLIYHAVTGKIDCRKEDNHAG